MGTKTLPTGNQNFAWGFTLHAVLGFGKRHLRHPNDLKLIRGVGRVRQARLYVQTGSAAAFEDGGFLLLQVPDLYTEMAGLMCSHRLASICEELPLNTSNTTSCAWSMGSLCHFSHEQPSILQVCNGGMCCKASFTGCAEKVSQSCGHWSWRWQWLLARTLVVSSNGRELLLAYPMQHSEVYFRDVFHE